MLGLESRQGSGLGSGEGERWQCGTGHPFCHSHTLLGSLDLAIGPLSFFLGFRVSPTPHRWVGQIKAEIATYRQSPAYGLRGWVGGCPMSPLSMVPSGPMSLSSNCW